MKQFSIRDLLFLVVIVALALGWWLDRRPVAARFQLNSSGNRAFLVDTATGQIWTQGYTPGSTVTGDGGLLPPKLPK